MSLILPDARLMRIAEQATDPATSDALPQFRAIAQAQARHMAREIVAFVDATSRRDGMAYGYDVVEWLQEEGVLE